MQRRDEAVRPQNPPKKSNRNHSACGRKKSLRIRRKEPDFKTTGTRSHPSITKSPRNPTSETECRPEPPIEIFEKKEQENISTTHYQKSEVKKKIHSRFKRTMAKKTETGRINTCDHTTNAGGTAAVTRTAWNPRQKLWFLLLAWYYCYNFFQSFFPLSPVCGRNPDGTQEQHPHCPPPPPNHEHKHRSKHTDGEPLTRLAARR